MKRIIGGHSRKIWSDEESKYLTTLTTESSQCTWKEIAEKINAKYNGSKTAKQCRERYRNYANPNIENSKWKPQEKILLVILHEIYGNQWHKIVNQLNYRSNVVIRDYFRSLIRKGIKFMLSKVVPHPIINQPEKFYIIYTILTSIEKLYLSKLNNLTIGRVQ